MLGISGGELAIVLVFGFLLFGPDKLPQMGRTIGRALRQFRETQEKLTAVVQTEVVDPMAAAAHKPAPKKQAEAAQDEDADAPEATAAPARKETFAERRARLAAEKAAAAEATAPAGAPEAASASDAATSTAESAAVQPAVSAAPAAADASASASAQAEAAPATPVEPEVDDLEALYARRPRKRAAAPAADDAAPADASTTEGGDR